MDVSLGVFLTSSSRDHYHSTPLDPEVDWRALQPCEWSVGVRYSVHVPTGRWDSVHVLTSHVLYMYWDFRNVRGITTPPGPQPTPPHPHSPSSPRRALVLPRTTWAAPGFSKTVWRPWHFDKSNMHTIRLTEKAHEATGAKQSRAGDWKLVARSCLCGAAILASALQVGTSFGSRM